MYKSYRRNAFTGGHASPPLHCMKYFFSSPTTQSPCGVVEKVPYLVIFVRYPNHPKVFGNFLCGFDRLLDALTDNLVFTGTLSSKILYNSDNRQTNTYQLPSHTRL